MTRIAIALAQDFADWEPALLAAAARSYLGVEDRLCHAGRTAGNLHGRAEGDAGYIL